MVAVVNDTIQYLKTRSKLGTSRFQVGFDVSATTILGSVGYKDLGASNAGSTKIDIPKGIYNTDTGSPVTTKFADITEWTGKIGTDLYEYNSLVVEEKVGTQLTTSIVAATYSGGGTYYAGTVDTTGSQFINGGSQLEVKAAASSAILGSLFPGDTVSFLLGTVGVNGGTWLEQQKVVDRDTAANTFVCEGYTTDVPPAGSPIIKVIYENNYIGGSDLTTKKLRVLTSLRDGSIFVLFSGKGVSDEGFNPNMGDGKSAILFPYNFMAFGTAQTIAGFDQPQVVIANHTIVRPVKTA